MKAEARLDLLRQVGVAVDTWLKSAMNQVCVVRVSESVCTCTVCNPVGNVYAHVKYFLHNFFTMASVKQFVIYDVNAFIHASLGVLPIRV